MACRWLPTLNYQTYHGLHNCTFIPLVHSPVAVPHNAWFLAPDIALYSGLPYRSALCQLGVAAFRPFCRKHELSFHSISTAITKSINPTTSQIKLQTGVATT